MLFVCRTHGSFAKIPLLQLSSSNNTFAKLPVVCFTVKYDHIGTQQFYTYCIGYIFIESSRLHNTKTADSSYSIFV